MIKLCFEVIVIYNFQQSCALCLEDVNKFFMAATYSPFAVQCSLRTGNLYFKPPMDV